ncbi:MAG: hypothetical protein ACRDYF_10335, partial [Acidimicrobiia bacterium]
MKTTMSGGTPEPPGWRLLTHVGVGAAAGLALDEALLAGYARDAGEFHQPPPKQWPPTLRLYTY